MTTMMSKKEFPLKLEDFDDNPWSVEDASAFLKYVCPECEYNNQTLQAFTEHALENHTKAKIFFTAETIAEQFKLDLIKNEDPEYFEYENYDCFEPANFSAVSDYYPNSTTLSPKPDGKPTKSVVKIEDPDTKDDFFDDNNHEEMQAADQDDDIMNDESTNNETTNICTFCNFLSLNKSGLAEHHKEKHRDKPPPLFKCDHCHFCHKKNKNVREHSEKVHRKKFFAYQCQTCNKQMMKFVSYRNHVKTACKTNLRKEQKTCELCVIEFPSRNELKKHKIERHMSNKMYCCPHCDYKAKHNWQALQKHIDYIHPESGEKKYFCEHCDKGYIFEPTLYYHKWSRHNGNQKHMCDICGKEYNNKAGYAQHMLLQHNTNEAANLMCEQCAFSTPSKEMLKRHIKNKHEMDKWNMCPHCDYKSPWIQKWQAHIDAKHPEHGEQKYFCDHCPKSFIFEGSLRRHMEKVRAKVNKPKKRKLQLPCDYCEKVLKSYHLAKVHYRNHHPGRPIIASGHANYNCSNCANRFFTADDLEAHLNVEHGIDTKKNYCKDCKQPLKDQEHTCHFHFANKEKKKHVPFKCLICRKEFATKNTMKRHMEQIHEGKTYPCDQCTRTFTAPNSLKNHILIVHEKRFDYECQHCGKKWATKGLLQDHITQSHTSQVICNICNKQISNPIMLRRHKVFVHNERDGALFCELCPKSVFFSESTFEKHARDKH